MKPNSKQLDFVDWLTDCMRGGADHCLVFQEHSKLIIFPSLADLNPDTLEMRLSSKLPAPDILRLLTFLSRLRPKHLKKVAFSHEHVPISMFID